MKRKQQDNSIRLEEEEEEDKVGPGKADDRQAWAVLGSVERVRVMWVLERARHK